MSEQLRVAIAGTGFIGAVHARSARLAGARLVGVAASTPERAAQAARELDAEGAFASAEELVEAEGVDVVHICTPNHLHLPLAEAALAAGKHVICEKPLALDADGALRLAHAAAAAARQAAVNQYRELASFAQFGSDLDKATQQTLNRGEHLTAILRQGELDPMPVEEQVVVLYAASNGYLDEIETDSVPDWESQFRDFMRDTHGDLLESIRDEQKLSDENEEKLQEAIEQFNSNYEPEQTSLVDISVEDDEDEEEVALEDENGEEEDQSREEEGS